MSDEGRRLHPTDPIEAGMESPGRVLHRDKLVARSLALIMAACTLFFGVAAVVFALGGGAGVPLVSRILTFVLLPLFPLVGLTRSVVRTLVTSEEVQIKWGLWGPRIPLAAITRCEALTTEQIRTEQGLAGPKLALDADRKGAWRSSSYHLYAPGHFTEAVWLEWTGDDGKPQRAILGSEAPKVLAAAIESARRARGGERIAAMSEVETAAHTSETESDPEEAAPHEARRRAGK